MDPLDFLATCSYLNARQNKTEADDRTILSRLYYAFFLVLRNGLAEKNLGFRINLKNSGADHALVRNYLRGVRFNAGGGQNPRGASRVPWYERYADLFVWRERADYVMDVPPQELSAKVAELMEDLPRLRPLVEDFVQ